MTTGRKQRGNTLRIEVDTFIGYAVAWPTLSDQELEDAIAELGEWVAWLILRYALDHRTVPPCWAAHGALVEELSALHTAWRSRVWPRPSTAAANMERRYGGASSAASASCSGRP